MRASDSHGSSVSISASRTRSAVGRVTRPRGVTRRRPFSSPAITRIASSLSLAYRGEIELPPPTRQQRLAEPEVPGIAQLRIRGDDGERVLARLVQDPRVAQKVRDAEVREARLARTEELARAAQAEIGLGDPEAVVRLGHRG